MRSALAAERAGPALLNVFLIGMLAFLLVPIIFVIPLSLSAGEFFNGDQVGNLFHHTKNLRGRLYFNSRKHFAQAKRLKGTLLALRAVDAALHLSDFNFCHFRGNFKIQKPDSKIQTDTESAGFWVLKSEVWVFTVYPLNTFFRLMLRSLATSIGSRNMLSAL